MSFTVRDVDNAFIGGNFTDLIGGNEYNIETWDGLEYGSGAVVINDRKYDWKCVASVGGEGEGEYRALVFSIDGRLFRKEGYYASHWGTEWDGDLEEVEEYEKTVTDYRPVKSS